MSGNVLQLHKSVPADEVVGTLRRIADQIEAGDTDWPVTTAVVVLGHVDAERDQGDGIRSEATYWRTYGAGPRADSFTVRGLLATVIHRGFGDD